MTADAPAAPGEIKTSAVAPMPHELRSWTIKGQPYRGRFVGQRDGKVTLQIEKLGEKTFARSLLDQAGQAQADEEEGKARDLAFPGLSKMPFVRIRHGSFMMGSILKEPGRLAFVKPTKDAAAAGIPETDIEPEHQVKLTQDFWMKQTEVTWDEWRAVANTARDNKFYGLGEGKCGSGRSVTGQHPVTDITWLDAVIWCNLKSQLDGLVPAYYSTPVFGADDAIRTGDEGLVIYVNWDARGYRLPTEAEWEYACRQGRSVRSPAFHSGDILYPGFEPLDPRLDDVAWYGGNSGGGTRPVATKKCNTFGLYDMHGNVAEWCWDFDGLLAYADATDPRGAQSGKYRVFRGGSWADPARCCRAAYRGNLSPIVPSSELIGFRPICGVDPASPRKDPAK